MKTSIIIQSVCLSMDNKVIGESWDIRPNQHRSASRHYSTLHHVFRSTRGITERPAYTLFVACLGMSALVRVFVPSILSIRPHLQVTTDAPAGGRRDKIVSVVFFFECAAPALNLLSAVPPAALASKSSSTRAHYKKKRIPAVRRT